MSSIYIIDYTNGIRTEHGPFSAVRFHHINTSIPKAQEDTVTYTVFDDDDNSDLLTVSIAHVVTSEDNKNRE